MPGEHEVHPYIPPGSLCRGESSIRPYPALCPVPRANHKEVTIERENNFIGR